MQKKTGLALLILALSVCPGAAQSTVNYGAMLGQPNIFYDGSLIPNGNQVRIGFFNPAFDVSAHLFDLVTMGASWNNYGDTVTRSLFNESGRFSDTDYLSAETTLFDNQPIWLWILKTSDNSLPSVDFANVTGYGLFSSSLESWKFPPYSAMLGLDTTSVYSSEVNQALFGSFDPDHLYLAAVPEPHTGLLLVIGTGVFWAVWRRRAGKQTLA